MNDCAHSVLYLSVSQARTFQYLGTTLPPSTTHSPTLQEGAVHEHALPRTLPQEYFRTLRGPTFFSSSLDFKIALFFFPTCPFQNVSHPFQTRLVAFAAAAATLPLLHHRLQAYRYLPVANPSLYPFFSRKVCNSIFIPITTNCDLGKIVIASLMQRSLASAHFALRALITNNCLIEFSLSRNTLCLAVPKQA